MSSCCSGRSTCSVLACPQCGVSGKNVSMKTMFHQVTFPDVLQLETDSY